MTRIISPTFVAAETDVYKQAGVWSGKLLPSYGAELASSQPDLIGIVDRGVRYTFGELEAWALDVADFLYSLGVGPGQAVTFQLPNWVEAVVLNQAILKLGAVSNPVIPIYREREMEFILREAESAVYVVPAHFRQFDYVGMALQLCQDIPTLRQVVTAGDSHRPGVVSLPKLPAVTSPIASRQTCYEGSPDDPVLLLYTSGTTANPKGVIHTHNTLIAEDLNMIEWHGWGSEDVVFMPAPVTHIAGYLYALLLPFILRTKAVLLDTWDPTKAVELIRDERCTITVAATTFLQDIVDTAKNQGLPAGSLPFKTFACGGAEVPPKLIYDALEYGVQAGRVYGSSEYPTFCCFSLASSIHQRAMTDGIPMLGENRIVDDDGNDCRPGETGELLVRGPEMFVGYLEASLNAEFTEHGWFRTGDLFTQHEDGYLEFAGRKKDIINRGGEKISSKEVEDLLFKHPLCHEVAVVAMPDERLTEKACAFIVPEHPDRPPTLEDLTEFLSKERVAKQKYPERLEIVSRLPKTLSGKIQKNVLREEIKRRLGLT
ncbi:MAG: cyclohexanecarboxylate-CoA ligase [Chloroflexota bacterium]|nr:MAG: cyclohexanecarboxylate-CoA ligase [Chloroflexota bacterium]